MQSRIFLLFTLAISLPCELLPQAVGLRTVAKEIRAQQSGLRKLASPKIIFSRPKSNIASLDGLDQIPNIESALVVNLPGNKIETIPAGFFKDPKFKKVRWLNLSGNKIRDIEEGGLEGLENLWFLFLGHNQMQAFKPETLKVLKNLKVLTLDGNLNEMALAKQARQQLPGVLITTKKLTQNFMKWTLRVATAAAVIATGAGLVIVAKRAGQAPAGPGPQEPVPTAPTAGPVAPPTSTTPAPSTPIAPIHLPYRAGGRSHEELVYDLDTINQALNTPGANVDVTDLDGNTYLIIAAHYGDALIVARLLREGANVNIASSNGQTALALAAQAGHTKIVDLLLRTPGINVDAADFHDNTPLMLAAYGGHADIVNLLLKAHADLTISNLQNKTAYDMAKEQGHSNIADTLRQQAAEERRRRKATEYKFVPIENPELEDIFAKGTGLVSAASEGDSNAVSTFIESGANVNVQDDKGLSALMVAASLGHYDVVERLLQAPGIDVNATDSDGNTPLIFAAEKGYKNIISMFIDKGVNVNAQNRRGVSALIFAASHGHPDVVERLLQAPGIDVNATNSDGNTPLMFAAYGGHSEIVNQLLARGADPTIRNPQNKTASDVAKEQGHSTIADTLRQAEEKHREAYALPPDAVGVRAISLPTEQLSARQSSHKKKQSAKVAHRTKKSKAAATA